MKPTKLYSRTVLALLTAMNVLNYMSRSVLFAIQPLIQATFRRPDADFGLLTSSFFLCHIITIPAVGPLADRYSRKLMIVLGALIWTGATALTALANSFRMLLICHAIVGVGQAFFVTVSPTYIADLFSKEKLGRTLGVFYLAVPVGAAAGYILGGLLGTSFGWRAPFYVASAPCVLLIIALSLTPEPRRGEFDSPRGSTHQDRAGGLLKNPTFWMAVLGMAAMNFALGGLQVWMPTFLSRLRGFSLASANRVFGRIIACSGIAASLAGGWSGDFVSRRTEGAYFLVAATSIALGVPVMTVALFTNGALMLPAIALSSFLLLLSIPPLNAAIINSVSASVRATAIAVNIITIHLLGDGLSPWLIGLIADRRSLQTGFSAAVLSMAVSSAILFTGARYAIARDTAKSDMTERPT